MFSLSFQFDLWPHLRRFSRETIMATRPFAVSGIPDPDLSEIEYRYHRGEKLCLIDWTVVVAYAVGGCERNRSVPRRMLPAFVSVFELRLGDANDGALDYYLGNLPEQVRGPGSRLLNGATKADMVRECASRSIQILAADVEAELCPMRPDKNLSSLLNFERLESERALNAALRPHWDALLSAAQAPPQTRKEVVCAPSVSRDR